MFGIIFAPFKLNFCLIILYNLFVAAYTFLIRLAAFRNKKAALWVKGRQNLWQELSEKINSQQSIIWFHSASTGEFEQAKPVIEALKKQYPSFKILITFFSSSGFEASRNYVHADYIFYLPTDTAKNAERFLKAIQPKLVLFSKYDFWYHHLKSVKKYQVPLLIFSASFHKDQAFFKWYGTFYKRVLYFFDWIFVQDKSSRDLLLENNVPKCSIGGDTRFDRVAEIAQNASSLPFIKEFINKNQVLIAGSTWPDDEAFLSALANKIWYPPLKFIIAPHEITKNHISDILKQFPKPVLYSQLHTISDASEFQTLIIDNVGMLSRLYRYATITYVGGGFTKDGIHNVLEAAVFAKPVIIGPNFKKYREAKELIAAGGAFSINDLDTLIKKVTFLMTHENALTETGKAAATYVSQNKGATGKIMQLIQEKRLLTK